MSGRRDEGPFFPSTCAWCSMSSIAFRGARAIGSRVSVRGNRATRVVCPVGSVRPHSSTSLRGAHLRYVSAARLFTLVPRQLYARLRPDTSIYLVSQLFSRLRGEQHANPLSCLALPGARLLNMPVPSLLQPPSTPRPIEQCRCIKKRMARAAGVSIQRAA